VCEQYCAWVGGASIKWMVRNIGFVAAASDLGLAVDNPRAFLREQQRLVFAWAQGTTTTDGTE